MLSKKKSTISLLFLHLNIVFTKSTYNSACIIVWYGVYLKSNMYFAFLKKKEKKNLSAFYAEETLQ